MSSPLSVMQASVWIGLENNAAVPHAWIIAKTGQAHCDRQLFQLLISQEFRTIQALDTVSCAEPETVEQHTLKKAWNLIADDCVDFGVILAGLTWQLGVMLSPHGFHYESSIAAFPCRLYQNLEHNDCARILLWCCRVIMLSLIVCLVLAEASISAQVGMCKLDGKGQYSTYDPCVMLCPGRWGLQMQKYGWSCCKGLHWLWNKKLWSSVGHRKIYSGRFVFTLISWYVLVFVCTSHKYKKFAIDQQNDQLQCSSNQMGDRNIHSW